MLLSRERESSLRPTGWNVYVTTATRHLDRLGQLGTSQQKGGSPHLCAVTGLIGTVAEASMM